MLISTALLLDSNIRNSVCTPSKLPCRRVVEGIKNHFEAVASLSREMALSSQKLAYIQ
jgi:hypothetical protein